MSDNPRHILMTADAAGGVWTYSLELARALDAHGIRLTLAVMGEPPTPDQMREAAGMGRLDVRHRPFRLEWMDDPWDDVDAAGQWLLELAAAAGPDVVHVNGFAHAALPFRAPVVCVAHSCVRSWWRAVKGEAAPERYSEYKRRVEAGLRSAHVVVAPTHAMLTALAGEYEFSNATCAIPNGRSAERFQPAAVKERLIFSAGRIWDEAKNLRALAEVAPALDWPVCVAGEAMHPGGGVHSAGTVRMLGQLPPAAVSEWLAKASVYALPARYEPFGLSALEAALSGCALVLGDIPSLREVWADAALFVPPSDSGALRDALERVTRSEVLRQDLASRARLRARRFTPERMAMGYLDAYQQARRNYLGRRRVAA